MLKGLLSADKVLAAGRLVVAAGGCGWEGGVRPDPVGRTRGDAASWPCFVTRRLQEDRKSACRGGNENRNSSSPQEEDDIMSADAGGQRRYVSTFRMRIKSGNGARSADGVKADAGVLPSHQRADPPVFVRPLQDCCVDEGDDITLSGVLSGSRPIKVAWLHNGEVARFGISALDGGDVSLVVRECLPEDAGAYTCMAENAAGKTSCCAAVFVRDFETIGSVQDRASANESIMGNGKPPQSPQEGQEGSNGTSSTSSDPQSPVSSPREVIPKKRANSGMGPVLHLENPPQVVEVKAGRTARVTCRFTGSPPVVSCWIRNKEQLADAPDVWIENSNESSTLVLASAGAQHTGRYTVVVKDRKSSTQHTLTLSVIDRPQPPASCPLVSLVSPGSLVLSWSGPCYDGGSAVLGYAVEVRPEGREWSELTAQCTSTSYRVCGGLQPGEEYRFRVRAYNAVGVSEPGPASPGVTIDHMDSKAAHEEEEEEEEVPEALVAIDSAHKVTDHYDVQEKLGMGKFGLVFKLKHRTSGRVCAGKFYKGRRSKEREAARREIELMNKLHHPKLVRCLAAYDHKPDMVMVMEFIAGGELFERIVDDTFEHTEPASVRYMRQILQGVNFMHRQRVVHLDLKPENIVCVDTSGTAVKIIDFGLATQLDGKTDLRVMQGTPEFVAPEVINYEPVCLAADMWSIGVICYILLSGESPFQGSSDADTLALVTAAQWEFDEESFEDITDQAKHFISSLLEKDPRRRMSCEEALAHAWMATFHLAGPASAKSLPKEKMKRFLVSQKWKKAGKAMLALKRMALLSKGDSTSSPTSPAEGDASLLVFSYLLFHILPSFLPGSERPLTPETKDALLSLERKMRGPPRFSKTLQDQTVSAGDSARLDCHLTGMHSD
ncbi:myosin light chain kinase, smooth muscle isoform X3 [Phyllopteryx taeniolatus]|uniref:myosin light chain kinase, smooth muscle isoform X3 n=1 Tax=Phyllopteryx taeniolatus TaxID=161469 RepID=UPI002AD416FD|nr:myosin light chain kinase, smooth muscle isoform X3 [Phyllopteryx taeniolatus]